MLYIFALNLLLLIPAALAPIFRRVFTDDILTGGATEWLMPLLVLMFAVALISAGVTWLKGRCEQNNLDLLTNIVFSAFYVAMMLSIHVAMTFVVIALVAVNFGMAKIKDFVVGRLSQETAPDTAKLMRENEQISATVLENIYASDVSKDALFQWWIGSKIAAVNAEKESDYEKASKPLESLSEIIFLNLLLFISATLIMDRQFSIGMYLAFQAFASAFFVTASEIYSVKEVRNG